jgi:hypothetical protein
VVRTHYAQVVFTARCTTCNWCHEFLHPEEAAEAVAEHVDAHSIAHTCSYDEHAGWLATDDCRGCIVERERFARRTA